MVLIRLAILLALLGLLVPKDERKQAELMATAKDAAHWTWTFCDRNGPECEQARELGRHAAAKAQDGLALLIATAREMAAARNQGAAPATDGASPARSAPRQQSAVDPQAAGTLAAEDRIPAWRAPSRPRAQGSS